MKLKMILLLTISFCLTNIGFSQVYENNQQGLKRSSLLNVQTEYFISYRAYIETSAEIGKVPCGLLTVVPLGVQLNPSLFIGLGISLPYLNDSYAKIIDSYTPFYLEGDNQKNLSITDEYHLEGMPMFIELKYNLLNIKHKIPHLNIFKEEQITPFISGSIGYSNGLFLPKIKFGATFYNNQNKGRLSGFIGVSSLPAYSNYRIAYDYQNHLTNVWKHTTTFENETYSNYNFSIGINYEFGGNAGFKTKPNK